MVFKEIVICVSVLFIQSISAQCYGARPVSFSSNCGCGSNDVFLGASGYGSSNGYLGTNSLSFGSNACSCGSNVGFVKTAISETEGPLTVTCYGPLTANGVRVVAELGIEGEVDVSGNLPFVSAVTFEGSLPSAGSGTVAYSCGDGKIAILQESGNPCGQNAASSSGLDLGALSRSCGCGRRNLGF